MTRNPDKNNNSFSRLSENLPDGSGWVFYRIPGVQKINFICGQVIESKIDDKIRSSFLIAPFHSSTERILQLQIDSEFHFKDKSALPERFGLPFFKKEKKGVNITESRYKKLVQKVLSEIGAGHIKKAVPARTMQIVLPGGFSEMQMFKNLLNAYPNAFVYLLSSAQTGTWAGCSPELLLKARDQEVETLSLAGTKKSGINSISKGNKDFSEKEFDEQDIVTGYIKNTLSRFCSQINSQGPDIQQAGNVSHLATHITGTLTNDAAKSYGALLKSLHPTPAVCGYPKEEALNFLAVEEGFDRSFYSGYLGLVRENSADIYVNLRCMEIFKNTASLYAGAGVVPGSDPYSEWLETEEKMQTLLSIIIPE